MTVLLRFILGGATVAAVPWVAAHSSARVAGIALLFPAVTLCGFLVLGTSRGTAAVADAARASTATLPVVLMFLLVVHLTARAALPLSVVLSCGLAAWLVGAAAAAFVLSAG